MVDNRGLVMATAIGDIVAMSSGKFGGTVEIKMAPEPMMRLPMRQMKIIGKIKILHVEVFALQGVMAPVKGRMAIGMSDGYGYGSMFGVIRLLTRQVIWI